MNKADPRLANRLGGALSPYLVAHSNDPVNWQPWDQDALRLARELDRPILLSVGYQACHWCHVMTNESFRDVATAELLNQAFVCIKVDREERPDIDRTYQAAQQLLTQRGGGWPLTMFLAPQDAQPFFGGTYFPPDERYGMPGFRSLLRTAADFYRDNKERAIRQGDALVQTLTESQPSADANNAWQTAELFALAKQTAEQRFDPAYGGFKGAPKFPNTPFWQSVLSMWRFTAEGNQADVELLYQTARTAEGLCRGGTFDHLEGGFFRYSVDAAWQIPHFEKMLGENALLLRWLAALFGVSGDPLYQRTIAAMIEWLDKTMSVDSGGFASSTSADLDHVEGAYYIVQHDELAGLDALGQSESLRRWYGLDGDADAQLGGWHIRETGDLSPKEQPTLSATRSFKEKLIAQRNVRAPAGPPRDNKVLTGANALMVSALIQCARLGVNTDAMPIAVKTLSHLRRCHVSVDGVVCYRLGDQRGPPGFLDDYAAVLLALLSALEVGYDDDLLDDAISIADTMIERFFDPQAAKFNFTEHRHATPPGATAPLADDALPSGNALAVRALSRLGYLLGEPKYLQTASRVVESTTAHIQQAPGQHTSLLAAAIEHRIGTEVVVIRGPQAEAEAWSAALGKMFADYRLILTVPDNVSPRHRAIAAKANADGISAIVCRGTTCDRPVSDFEALCESLRQTGQQFADAVSTAVNDLPAG